MFYWDQQKIIIRFTYRLRTDFPIHPSVILQLILFINVWLVISVE